MSVGKSKLINGHGIKTFQTVFRTIGLTFQEAIEAIEGGQLPKIGSKYIVSELNSKEICPGYLTIRVTFNLVEESDQTKEITEA